MASACAPVLSLWHVQVLLLEMCAAYNALRAGEQPELPPVRLQYPDFAAWHARRAASDVVARQVIDLQRCACVRVVPQCIEGSGTDKCDKEQSAGLACSMLRQWNVLNC